MKSLIVITTATAILLSSCGQASEATATETAMPATEMPPSSDTAYFGSAEKSKADGSPETYDNATTPHEPEEKRTARNIDIPEQRKVVRNGDMRIETQDINATQVFVRNSVQRLGGYISSDNREQLDNRIEQSFEIKVPFQHFDSLLNLISGHVKYVDRLNVSSQDVTDEYIDVQARIKTRKELEAKYIQYLRAAKTRSETREIEQDLALLRSEIESAEGRLRFLSNQTSFSTLKLLATQHNSSPKRFGNKFVDAAAGGWNFILSLFVFLVQIWPAFVIGGVVYWFFRRKAKS